MPHTSHSRSARAVEPPFQPSLGIVPTVFIAIGILTLAMDVFSFFQDRGHYSESIKAIQVVRTSIDKLRSGSADQHAVSTAQLAAACEPMRDLDAALSRDYAFFSGVDWHITSVVSRFVRTCDELEARAASERGLTMAVSRREATRLESLVASKGDFETYEQPSWGLKLFASH